MEGDALTQPCAHCGVEFTFVPKRGPRRIFCSSKCRRESGNQRIFGGDPTSGWVYLLSNPAWPGKFKLGKTANLYARFNVYQAGDPNRAFKFEATWKVTDRHAIEKLIHDIFRPCRVKGSTEWYELEVATAITMLDTLPQLERCHDSTIEGRPRIMVPPASRKVRDRNSNGA